MRLPSFFLFLSFLFLYTDAAPVRVDFHKSMSVDRHYEQKFALKDQSWMLLERLYNNFWSTNSFGVTQEVKIPLILHHIWLGSDLPEYAVRFRESWIKMHPHWTFILWTDHPSKMFGNVCLSSFAELNSYLQNDDAEQFIVMDMNALRLENQYAYEKRAKNYGEKSDILRYEVLYNIGGLYVDTDFECLKSFDDFHFGCDFYTGINHHNLVSLCNGLIGSRPNSTILEDMIERLHNRERRVDSLTYTGPHFFTECFLRTVQYFAGIAVAFPVTYFYPWPHYLRQQSIDKAQKMIKPESYAFHYWKVSWLKP